MPPASTAPRVAGRLWLDFVNTDDEHRGRRTEHLADFSAWIGWLHDAGVLDAERAQWLERRAAEQPMGAQAALLDARRVRNALRLLAERGATQERARDAALAEVNRILERSAGTRRVEAGPGGFTRAFRAGGDLFGALLLPVVEGAADALVAGEVARVKRCGAPGCGRVYLDATRNHSRRWCTMADCGNRAKAARHRARQAGARGRPGGGATPPRSPRPSRGPGSRGT
jgi:predicted RNA-binding Zn ribbon-like protein